MTQSDHPKLGTDGLEDDDMWDDEQDDDSEDAERIVDGRNQLIAKVNTKTLRHGTPRQN
jgi:hypothetical protein